MTRLRSEDSKPAVSAGRPLSVSQMDPNRAISGASKPVSITGLSVKPSFQTFEKLRGGDTEASQVTVREVFRHKKSVSSGSCSRGPNPRWPQAPQVLLGPSDIPPNLLFQGFDRRKLDLVAQTIEE